MRLENAPRRIAVRHGLFPLLIVPLFLSGCTTAPGLWMCDVLLGGVTAGLERGACEINCDTKYYDRSSNSDYAYQRCIFNCREKPVDIDQCTKAAKAEAEKSGK